jgi:hypothetical protein
MYEFLTAVKSAYFKLLQARYIFCCHEYQEENLRQKARPGRILKPAHGPKHPGHARIASGTRVLDWRSWRNVKESRPWKSRKRCR